MSFGPVYGDPDASTGFPDFLLKDEAQRKGEIREAQKITRILKDMVDADKMPLADPDQQALYAQSTSDAVRLQQMREMDDENKRYNNYIEEFNNGIIANLRKFEAPLAS